MTETYFIFDKNLSNHSPKDSENLQHRLKNFIKSKNSEDADFIVSFGGDGTLLDCFKYNPYKKIYPIRDYKTCEKHQSKIDSIYTWSKFDVLKLSVDNVKLNALSEIVLRNTNISTAMRCNLYVNDNLYAENIIGDGLIFSTALGSTGYFKNVTHTFFTKGNIGIGFINNAQNMTNFIIPIDSKIRVEIVRAGAKGYCDLACDHDVLNIYEGSSFEITKANFSARLINYKNDFMCENCRRERHSANVNAIYKVI